MKKGGKKKARKGLGCGGRGLEQGLGGGQGLCLAPTGPEKALAGWEVRLRLTQQEVPRSASVLEGLRTRSGTPVVSLGLSGWGKC